MGDSEFKILATALETIEDALGIYDSNDLLIAFNRQYAEVRTAIGGKVYLGCRWDDLITASLRAGGIVEALGREEAWLAERRSLRGAYDVERALPDGRRYQVSEKRLPNGGIASVWTQVFPQKPPAPKPVAAPPLAAPEQLVASYDPDALRAKARWLRAQAAVAEPEHRGAFLRLAEECERLVEQSLLTPPIRH